VESDPLAKMGSATAPQAAIGIVADQKEEKVEEPLAARTLRIAGTLATERHDRYSPGDNTMLTRPQKEVSYGNLLVGFKPRVYRWQPPPPFNDYSRRPIAAIL